MMLYLNFVLWVGNKYVTSSCGNCFEKLHVLFDGKIQNIKMFTDFVIIQ